MVLQRARLLAPAHPDLALNLGMAWLLAGRTDAALAELQAAEREYAVPPITLLDALAHAWGRAGQLDRARGYGERSLLAKDAEAGATPAGNNVFRSREISITRAMTPAIVVMPEDNRQVSIISAGSGTISERSWTCLTRCVQVLGPTGTNYVSLAPGTLGSQLDKQIASQAKANETLGNAAESLSQSIAAQNKSVSDGAKSVGGAVGQGGIMITP